MISHKCVIHVRHLRKHSLLVPDIMSIPPLVCSTPPPPDQCEDDKDRGDFDLQYSLSQDEENYEFDSFSSYNCFGPPNIPEKNPTVPETRQPTFNIINNKNEENFVLEVNVVVTGTNEDKLKYDDDNNIEDLNLCIDQDNTVTAKEIDIMPCKKININQESLCNTYNAVVEEETFPVTCFSSDVNECMVTQNSDSDKIAHEEIQKQRNYNLITGIHESVGNQFCSDEISSEQLHNMHDLNKSIIDITPHKQTHDSVECRSLQINQEIYDSIDIDSTCQYESQEKYDKKEMNVPETARADIVIKNISVLEDSDFDKNDVNTKCRDPVNNAEEDEDGRSKPPLKECNIDPPLDDSLNNEDNFGNFNLKNANVNGNIIHNDSDNPWENINTESNDFGEFKANFEENPINISEPINECTDKNISIQFQEPEDEDDFGDFDDFKSSSVDVKTCAQPNDLQMLNLHTSDNESQFIERISIVLRSVFEQELKEDDCEFEGKLESFLCETWCHLVDTDVRQPYMVNWNNSLGQKTLLKALCIDSRNILFGPKWSCLKPKYATTLTTSPLQPQKPSLSAHQSDSLAPDKISSKTLETWMDPFTSNGKESCNSEAERAADQRESEIVEFQVLSNANKIYSDTLGVQPLRHINLPDTHIFTPTNSETPRSKTIHYGLPIVLKQDIAESGQIKTDDNCSIAPVDSNTDTTHADTDDFSEFEDYRSAFRVNDPPFPFKSKTDNIERNESDVKPKIYETQILQPIKIEPLMPTLNWPDPGEVKETYEDFSDFVSSTSWDNPNADHESIPSTDDNTRVVEEHISANTDKQINGVIDTKELKSKSDVSFDDFDIFKSALPAPVKFVENKEKICNKYIAQTEISADISIPSSIKTVDDNMDSLAPHNHYVPSKIRNVRSDSPVNPSHSLNTILQPTQSHSVAVSKTSQKVGQILQPMSLESISQINWPNPGINLQDLSRFNPVESLQSLKNDSTSSGKSASPVHSTKKVVQNKNTEDDVWGDFVSSKPRELQQQTQARRAAPAAAADDDEWTDFVSSASASGSAQPLPVNTISFNVHSLSSRHTPPTPHTPTALAVDIPSLNYITPKSNIQKAYDTRHFQNL